MSFSVGKLRELWVSLGGAATAAGMRLSPLCGEPLIHTKHIVSSYAGTLTMLMFSRRLEESQQVVCPAFDTVKTPMSAAAVSFSQDDGAADTNPERQQFLGRDYLGSGTV